MAVTALKCASASEATQAAHALFGTVLGQHRLASRASNSARMASAQLRREGLQMEADREMPAWEAFGPQWFILKAVAYWQKRVSAQAAAEAAAAEAAARVRAARARQEAMVELRLR